MSNNSHACLDLTYCMRFIQIVHNTWLTCKKQTLPGHPHICRLSVGRKRWHTHRHACQTCCHWSNRASPGTCQKSTNTNCHVPPISPRTIFFFFFKGMSNCSKDPYSPYLQDFFTAVSLTQSTIMNMWGVSSKCCSKIVLGCSAWIASSPHQISFWSDETYAQKKKWSE